MLPCSLIANNAIKLQWGKNPIIDKTRAYNLDVSILRIEQANGNTTCASVVLISPKNVLSCSIHDTVQIVHVLKSVVVCMASIH